MTILDESEDLEDPAQPLNLPGSSVSLGTTFGHKSSAIPRPCACEGTTSPSDLPSSACRRVAPLSGQDEYGQGRRHQWVHRSWTHVRSNPRDSRGFVVSEAPPEGV